jgi:AcrR family transcriptional regulator
LRRRTAGKDATSEDRAASKLGAAGNRATTEALLESAALELLAENGVLAGLNLREVCDRVQVNRGLIYHYFGSRRDLLRSALRRRGNTLAARLADERSGRHFVDRVVEDLHIVSDEADSYRLIALLALDGDPHVRVSPLKDRSIMLLKQDQASGDLPSSTDVEALHVLMVSAAAGYSLFRSRLEAEMGIPSGALDPRVRAMLRAILTAYAES